MKYEAEAKGIRQVLDCKAAGYSRLVESCNGDAKAAATLLMIEKIEQIVARQVEAIQNLKIDKITVWDSGAAADGAPPPPTSSPASSRACRRCTRWPRMAGVELPDYLGQVSPDSPDGEAKRPESTKKP